MTLRPTESLRFLPPQKKGTPSPQGRRLWEKDPIRYRQIVPLTQDDQIDWIRDFVGQLEPGREREVLSATLGADDPIAAFVEAISDLPEYRKAWRQTFSKHVTTRITNGVLEQHLTIFSISNLHRTPIRQMRVGPGLALDRAQC